MPHHSGYSFLPRDSTRRLDGVTEPGDPPLGGQLGRSRAVAGWPTPADMAEPYSSAWREGEAGNPVTVVSLPGRRAAGGRPQGRP
jgi:hypothetical protein